MNDEERNVMTILTLARIVESTLSYCVVSKNAVFTKEERQNRYEALKSLTAEGTPFDANCQTNGDAGKELREMMDYFIDDVYGDPGRIVTLDIQGNVQVEQSLTIELFSNIVKLRAYLEAFLVSGLNFLKANQKLEPEFESLIQTDIRYYHAYAGKISCLLISAKFLELNQNANTYTDSYSKAHNGIDPHQDPEFNVRNDPSFRMLENEFHELNQDMVNVLNTYGNEDEEFKHAREQVYNDCDIFSGKKQTTDINAYFNIFCGYFDRILQATQNPLNGMFMKVGQELSAYESEAQKKAQAAEKPAEKPAEAQPEEKK
jgi:hypothetical protein